MNQRAFTLMELLIVIAIIAILAGIGLSVVPMVRKQANNTKCSNNLRQVGIAIATYRQDNADEFPYDLGNLKGMSDGVESVLVCPFDLSKGGTPSFNRPAAWGDDLSNLYESGCSYLFEVSSHPLTPTEQNWGFPDGSTWGSKGGTWWKAKQFQLNSGNNPVPSPFRQEDFPIVRCFWHRQWTAADVNGMAKQVLNLAWDYSIFWSIPYWEHQANPSIPLQ